MHVGLADHPVQERDVIDAARKVRHEVTDPSTALAVTSPSPGALHDRAWGALEQLDLTARVELVGGTVSVDGTPGATTLTARVPLGAGS